MHALLAMQNLSGAVTDKIEDTMVARARSPQGSWAWWWRWRAWWPRWWRFWSRLRGLGELYR